VNFLFCFKPNYEESSCNKKYKNLWKILAERGKRSLRCVAGPFDKIIARQAGEAKGLKIIGSLEVSDSAVGGIGWHGEEMRGDGDYHCGQ
jgi:hypothetical protein